MDFSTWKGGECFNDKYAVDDATKLFLKGELSKEDLMSKLGITNANAILTAEQQQKLGFLDYNKIRTFKHFERSSELWKDSGKTPVKDWIEAHPEPQVKKTDLEKPKAEIGEAIYAEYKKPKKGTYEWWMEKADRAKNKADMNFWDKITGHHSKEYYLEQAEKVKPKDNAKEITSDKNINSTIKPEASQESLVMSPRGIPYTQNDIDYLLNNGYTPEMAYELLAKHPKYMKIDMSEVPKAPNGKEFSEDDIRNLLIKGYKMEDAINLLSKDKKYALEGVSKQEQITKDIGDAAKKTEAKIEDSKTTSIKHKSGDAVSNLSADSSLNNVSDVGKVAEQAESAKTQASQASMISEQSEGSSTSDLVKWAVSRIEAKLDGVISAIQNCGGNKSSRPINQYLQDDENSHADNIILDLKGNFDGPTAIQ